jgi:hypothetical protein
MNDKVEAAGRVSATWGLQQLDKLNHTLALETAKVLKAGSATGVAYLTDPNISQTAETVNHYLFDLLLAKLNPAVGAAIDVAAGILDDVLQVPIGTTLTKAEIQLLASFVKGLGEGCDDFLAGTLVVAPVARHMSSRGRMWLTPTAPVIEKSKSVKKTTMLDLDRPGDDASEHVPPVTLLGVTCENGEQPGYFTYFGWIPTVLLNNATR